MQRINGFINIEGCKIIRECNAKTDGSNCKAWLEFGDKACLFKAGTEKNSIAEMFWSYALTHLGKSNVGYDLAKYNGCYGVITQNYNPHKYDTFSLADMIFKYRNFLEQTEGVHYFFDHLYNLEDLKKAINFNFSEKYDEQSLDNLNREILELFIIQILFGNGDMHGHNGEIWIPDGPLLFHHIMTLENMELEK